MKSALNALQDGLVDGGMEIITNFPGFESHKLFDLCGGTTTSVNEKISYEIAWGHSFAGLRSVVTFKNVGLNDAADAFLNSMVVGVNAGLVVVVIDDVDMEGSQSRQDSRHYFDVFGGLWLEPYSLQSAYDLAYASFQWSEQFQVPVVIRLTNALIRQQGGYKQKRKQNVKRKPVPRDSRRFLIHPINAAFQMNSLRLRNENINSFVNSLYTRTFNNANTLTHIVFGPPKEPYLKNEINLLQLFTYPLPKKGLMKLVSNRARYIVCEYGDSFGTEKIRSLYHDNLIVFESQQHERCVDCPTSRCQYCPMKNTSHDKKVFNYENLFTALKRLRLKCVVCDLGGYSVDHMDQLDAALCFGSALSVGLGINLAGVDNALSITGDAAFLHSGKNVLPEVLKRKISLKTIVICNDGSQGTGGQRIPGTLPLGMPGIEEIQVSISQGSKVIFRTLQKMMRAKRSSILYLKN